MTASLLLTGSADDPSGRPDAGDSLGGPDASRGAPLIMPAVEYHAIKALSAGMIWTMDSECPLKAWLASPWNPDREPENATHFDIGTAAHLAVLEPHLLAERVHAHGYDDYRTTAAKEARAAAYEAGKTPLKPAEFAMVEGMQKAIQSHRMAKSLFGKGVAEGTLTWEWNGLPCKCRPDFLPKTHGSWMVDLKTTTTANPKAVARKAANDGWFVRAAWYMNGYREVTGILPAKYLFVVVEVDAPHMIEIYELDERALVYGEQIIARTLKRAVDCIRTGHWPSYGDGGITKLALPAWAEFQRAEREEDGEFGE